MRNVFRIYINDIKKIAGNWVALIVIGGVLFLPAAYAWFNIAANMDPYSNTQDVKIAVSNCDQGFSTEMTGSLNAGDSIVENLKKNDKLGWQFVDRNEAVEGVRAGKYYAALVIPERFSEELTSIVSGKIELPSIEYYVNEKKNAIAPKVTDTGATTIQNQINETFVQIASEAVVNIFKESGVSVQGSINDKMDAVTQDLQDVENVLQDQQNQLDSIINGEDGTRTRIASSRELLTQLSQTAGQGSQSITDSQNAMKQIRNGFEGFSAGIFSAVTRSQGLLSGLNSAAASDLNTFSNDMASMQSKVNGLTESGRILAEWNDSELDRLQKINDRLVNQEKQLGIYNEKYDLQSKITGMRERNENYRSLLTELDNIASGMNGVAQNLESGSQTISNDIQSTQKALSRVQNTFAGGVLPEINNSFDLLTQHMSELSATLDQVGPLCSQLDSLLVQLDSTMEQTYGALQSTAEMISVVEESISMTAGDLDALRSAINYGAYSELLTGRGIDADKVADFVSAPVSLQTEELYPVSNYGSGMTPFYTNLAIWVSGIVLVSLLKMEIDKEERKRLSKEGQLTVTETYFGRWLLFMTIGLMQAIVICIGNLVLLRVQCESVLKFLLAGCVVSFVYINMIYALAITLKHIGKALCVFLVILQIPGSAGTFPIELTPVFFQRLHCFLPFTYGVDAMREAMFGSYGHLYIRDLLKLQIFTAVSLIFGLGVRSLILNMNRMIDVRLERTGLFACEESGMTRQRVRLMTILGILAGDDTMREHFRNLVKRHDIIYRKSTRIGFFLVLFLPLIFLITMFIVDESAKMPFLILWIGSLIGICCFLILVEYVHEKIREYRSYINRSTEELEEAMKEELRS